MQSYVLNFMAQRPAVVDYHFMYFRRPGYKGSESKSDRASIVDMLLWFIKTKSFRGSLKPVRPFTTTWQNSFSKCAVILVKMKVQKMYLLYIEQ